MGMRCRYQSRTRKDLPHKGPCSVPLECKHPETPAVVHPRQCKWCRHKRIA